MDTVSLSFLGITFLSLFLLYMGTGRNRRILAAGMLWLLLSGCIAATGFLQDTDAVPPRFLLIIGLSVVLFIYCYRQVVYKKLRIEYLLGLHVLRLPVELVLYALYRQGKVPELMTFRGWNFDIFTGISALLLLLYILISGKNLPRGLMVVWNIAGLVLLGIIVGVAVLSAPLPVQQLAFDQPNVAVLEFPYVFLPGYVVPAVFVAHLLLLKREWKKD